MFRRYQEQSILQCHSNIIGNKIIKQRQLCYEQVYEYIPKNQEQLSYQYQGDQKRNVSQQGSQVQILKLIFFAIYKSIQYTQTTILPITKLSKLRYFDCKYMVQQKYNSEILSKNLDQEIDKLLGSDQQIQNILMDFLSSQDIMLNNSNEGFILVTSYGDPLFNRLRNHYKINLLYSLQPVINIVVLQELEQLQERAEQHFVTYDSQVILNFISTKFKRFLTNAFLKDLIEFQTQYNDALLPIYLGLISFQVSKQNYNILLSKAVINVTFSFILFSQQNDMQIRGTWKFQNGQISIQSDEESKEQDVLQKMKLPLMEKNRFFTTLQDSLLFLNSKQLWGYSFTIIYFIWQSKNQEFKNQFQCENQKGYIIGEFSNLFDGLEYSESKSMSIQDPEVYSSFLHQQLTDLL